jgi:hypothetical protein
VSTVKRIGDRIRVQLEPPEVRLLRSLHDGLVATLDDPEAGDPVIERLFPSAVLGDDEADREVRALLRDELLEQRRNGLAAVVQLLDEGTSVRGRVRLDLEPDGAELMLGVLNDLRLAIGARIGVEHLDRPSIERDPTAADDALITSLAVMDHLGWMQEQLLEALDPSSASGAASADPDD